MTEAEQLAALNTVANSKLPSSPHDELSTAIKSPHDFGATKGWWEYE